ncbi:serine O-acetyltransferase [Planctomyces sp. SH-PL62]|uniref:serine O-acetyltransferase n=1 Tax=Planctomyces sp. SH-PL62 TaxID=1636152 RepID=UPI00078B24B6|nr:serine acetyltransferase [Planctomyces sp. SH-PL62]AMV40039.1 Serine acetyltransferase [Planctomyces sp. SH-PL62]
MATEANANANSNGKLRDSLPDLTSRIVSTYKGCESVNHLGHSSLPSYREVVEILGDLREVLFPGYGRRQNLHMGNVAYHVGDLIDGLYDRLCQQLTRAFQHDCQAREPQTASEAKAEAYTIQFLERIPELRETAGGDVKAAFEGDPAASSLDEIVFCYPGVSAITVYRLAHELYNLGVPLIPRMMTEYAHGKTGIDIHPGARIGREFFIDHGTGVVVGQTTEIGDRVKIYQGVTLGALSFPRDEATGEVVRGRKRHPTIEHDVVIYANATILGGETTIGHHAVVGSSAWITRSVAPYTTVTIENPKLRYRESPDVRPDDAYPQRLNYQI